RECWCDRPDRENQRKVEGCDDRDHPGRTAARERPAGFGRGEYLALWVGRQRRGFVADSGSHIRFQRGFCRDRSRLAYDPVLDFRTVLQPELAGAAQHPGAFGGWSGCPVTLCPCRGIGGLVDIVGARHAETAELVSRGRLDHVLRATAARAPAGEVDLVGPSFVVE